MIRMQELKRGDFVVADHEGEQWEGIVKDLNWEDKEVCLKTDVQEFWFKPDVLHPIPLNEEQLLKLKFQKQEMEDNSVKYNKGAFRIFLPKKGDFSIMDIWYREDRRHLTSPISVHQLQNHHNQMTKVDLTRN